MRGRLDVREIEDLGEDVIGFAELKAIASGDPLILEKAKIDAEVERLGRVHRAWQRGHHALRSTITAGEERAGVRERQIAAVNQALPRVRDTRGDLFTITINDHSYTHRTDAASALAASLRTVARGPARPVAQLAGLQVDAELLGDQTGEQYLHLTLHGLPAQPATLKRSQLADAGLSLIRQLEHRVHTLPELAARLEHERDEALRESSRRARPARTPVQVRRPARRRAPPARAHRPSRSPTATTSTRTPSAQPRSPASTPTPPPRSRSRTAPIPSQPRPTQPTPVPAAPTHHGEPPPAGERDLEPETAESLRLLRAAQAKPIEEALRSPAAANPPARESHPRTVAVLPTPPLNHALRRAPSGSVSVSSGFWLAPYGGGAGECCVADLDVQRFLAVGVKERLQLRGVIEQARARVRRAGHPAQHAL